MIKENTANMIPTAINKTKINAIDKYPNITHILDFYPFLIKPSISEIVNFAFISTLEFKFLKTYHADLFSDSKYEYMNIDGSITNFYANDNYYHNVMCSCTMEYRITFLVYNETTILTDNKGKSKLITNKEENLELGYSIVTFNGQKLYVLYSNLFHNDFYKTSDKNIDIELIKVFLENTFYSEKHLTYKLYSSYSEVRELVKKQSKMIPLVKKELQDEWVSRIPSYIIKWLTPEQQQDKALIEILVNEYRLERL